jgi:hypothetical protein
VVDRDRDRVEIRSKDRNRSASDVSRRAGKPASTTTGSLANMYRCGRRGGVREASTATHREAVIRASDKDRVAQAGRGRPRPYGIAAVPRFSPLPLRAACGRSPPVREGGLRVVPAANSFAPGFRAPGMTLPGFRAPTPAALLRPRPIRRPGSSSLSASLERKALPHGGAFSRSGYAFTHVVVETNYLLPWPLACILPIRSPQNRAPRRSADE